MFVILLLCMNYYFALKSGIGTEEKSFVRDYQFVNSRKI